MSAQRSEPESTYAWLRLGAALAVMTIGGSGMYAMAVALAPVQAEFGVTRGDASLPYTLTMLGFGIGGIVMGRLADRFGVVVPVMHRRARPRQRLHPRGQRVHPAAVQPRARPADRLARLLDHLRAAGRRHLALVHPAPRHRGGDLRQRQLSRRRGVAADPAVPLRHRRLARDLHRHGNLLRRHHAAVRAGAAPAAAGAGNFLEREPDRARTNGRSAWRPMP